MKLGDAVFNASSTSFVPKGKFIAGSKEEFPDFDALGDDKPKAKKGKGKNKKKAVVTQAKQEDEVDEADQALPWKGKKKEFFELKISETPLNDPSNPNNF